MEAFTFNKNEQPANVIMIKVSLFSNSPIWQDIPLIYKTVSLQTICVLNLTRAFIPAYCTVQNFQQSLSQLKRSWIRDPRSHNSVEQVFREPLGQAVNGPLFSAFIVSNSYRLLDGNFLAIIK